MSGPVLTNAGFTTDFAVDDNDLFKFKQKTNYSNRQQWHHKC